MGLFGGLGEVVGTFFGAPPGVGSAVGGFLDSSMAQHSANAFASGQTQAQMDFQERMSSTAHQREVKDLEAAGLNPMLSARLGGASTPSGAAASFTDVANPSTNSSTQAFLARQQAENLAAQSDAAKATAANQRSQAAVNAALIPKVNAETILAQNSANQALEQIKQLQAMVNEINARIPTYAQTIKESGARIPTYGADVSNKAAQTKLLGTQNEQVRALMPFLIQATSAEAAKASLGLPKAGNEASAQESWWKKNISPYLPDLSGAASSAGSLFNFIR